MAAGSSRSSAFEKSRLSRDERAAAQARRYAIYKKRRQRPGSSSAPIPLKIRHRSAALLTLMPEGHAVFTMGACGGTSWRWKLLSWMGVPNGWNAARKSISHLERFDGQRLRKIRLVITSNRI